MVSLKHLAFGAATSAWQDYFQMGSTTSRKAVEELCFTVSTNNTLCAKFVCPLSHPDAVHVSEMHEEAHGIMGMLGSLDCMHV